MFISFWQTQTQRSASKPCRWRLFVRIWHIRIRKKKCLWILFPDLYRSAHQILELKFPSSDHSAGPDSRQGNWETIDRRWALHVGICCSAHRICHLPHHAGPQVASKDGLQAAWSRFPVDDSRMVGCLQISQLSFPATASLEVLAWVGVCIVKSVHSACLVESSVNGAPPPPPSLSMVGNCMLWNSG